MLNEFSKKEAPIQGLAGMGGGVPSRLLTLASGTTTYVDDVFSTFLYDGTGSAQTITNGIDLDGEGGLVWAKSRTNSRNHIFSDTERGTGKVLFSNLTAGTDTDATTITSYNSNGWTMGTSSYKMNTSGEEFVSWTFRKCPGFFDIVTYTGNGSVRTIAHNLRSVPGSIWVKRLDTTSDWRVYHRSLSSAANQLYLNANTGENSAGPVWNSTDPTSSVFTVGTDSAVNANGATYVAYLFAHNDGSFGESSDEAVIKCGSYAGSGGVQTISLGFEPQWVLIKNRGAAYNWIILDMMRVWTEEECIALVANNSDADSDIQSLIDSRPDPNGFTMSSNYDFINKSGNDYIYIAIRRPHKPPETGTDVFKPELLTSASQTFNPGFAPDMNWHMFDRSSSSGFAITGTRLTGNSKYLQTYANSAEAGSGSNWEYDAPTGKFTQGISTGSTSGGIEYFFKRAPGFLDIVTWTGNGVTGRTINHNLGVAPEFMMVKRRSGSENWYIYHKQPGATKAASFNLSAFGSAGVWDDTEPTATTVALMGDNAVNGDGETYVGFFFASLDGISKVGSYSGGSSASNIDIDCGFTAGARFVLIKRTDNYVSTANWFIYDSARGIVSGNDPYLKLNGGTEVTNTDYIDPLNAGFTVTSSAPSGMNGDDGTFMFLAIA